MRKTKKILSVILSVVALCLSFGNCAYATELNQTSDIMLDEDVYGPYLGQAKECDTESDMPINEDSSCQYFLFVDDGQKMDGNGNFTFSFSWAMESTSFKPAGSSIDVYAAATSSNSDTTYYIGVKEVGGSSLGYYSYTANGSQQYGGFSGLNPNKWYVLYFSKPLQAQRQSQVQDM